jgi:hypothetical protein
MNTTIQTEVNVSIYSNLSRIIAAQVKIFQLQMATVAYRKFVSEHQDRILPPNHHTTREIAHVVDRLLTANRLGVLNPSYLSCPTPIEPFMNPRDASWTADDTSDTRAASRGKHAEWNLIVVDDDKTIHGAAAYGICHLPFSHVYTAFMIAQATSSFLPVFFPFVRMTTV